MKAIKDGKVLKESHAMGTLCGLRLDTLVLNKKDFYHMILAGRMGLIGLEDLARQIESLSMRFSCDSWEELAILSYKRAGIVIFKSGMETSICGFLCDEIAFNGATFKWLCEQTPADILAWLVEKAALCLIYPPEESITLTDETSEKEEVSEPEDPNSAVFDRISKL